MELRSGKPVEHPLLKKHNVELTYMTKDDMIDYMKKQEEEKDLAETFVDSFAELFKGMFGFDDFDLTFLIKDSNNVVLMVELLNKNGEVMEKRSWSNPRDRENGLFKYGVSYQRMLPFKGKVRVYINDGKSIKRVPFKHKITLP